MTEEDEVPDSDTDNDVKDPGRIEGCFLVLAVMGIYLFMGGLNNVTGILAVEWVEHFNTEYRIVGLIGTCSASVAYFFAPIGGLMVKRFGLRRCLVISGIVHGCVISCLTFATNLWVILSIWIIAGLCQAFHIGPSVAYIMIRFRRYRSIAIAFVISSSALGTIVFGVIINKSIEAYTWRGAVLILGALSSNTAASGLLLRNWNKRPRKKDILLKKEEEGFNGLTAAGAEKQKPNVEKIEEENATNSSIDCRNILHLEVFKQPGFIGHNLAVLFLYTAISIIFVHIVSGFRDLCKLELEDARYLVPCLGTSDLIGRFVVLMISHHPRVDTFTLFLAVNILLGTTVAIVPLFEGFTAATILAILIGAGMSGFSGLCHLVLAEIIEEKYIHMCVQYMLFTAGVAYIIGAPLAGWVYDVTGNYVFSFELTASLVGVSVLILSPFWVKHIRQLRSKSRLETSM
ncbi:monocarboxylate transporter 14-like [Tubulanus polymorphus]|uniref:monocarboxylate transporter 14-like n=1 Tax=Tubulanus polymorphus TaxID=672921 RepID=UPI003DA6A975